MSGLRIVEFLAVVLTGLALVPSGAHLFALPNKIGLAEEPYFVVQNIYRGWALLGILWFAALIADLGLATMLRGQRGPYWLALLAFVLILATLAIFFLWTYPANQATDNWTTVPANWEELRWQWEYSHAINAGLMFVAFCAVTIASLWARK